MKLTRPHAKLARCICICECVSGIYYIEQLFTWSSHINNMRLKNFLIACVKRKKKIRNARDEVWLCLTKLAHYYLRSLICCRDEVYIFFFLKKNFIFSPSEKYNPRHLLKKIYRGRLSTMKLTGQCIGKNWFGVLHWEKATDSDIAREGESLSIVTQK